MMDSNRTGDEGEVGGGGEDRRMTVSGIQIEVVMGLGELGEG